MNPTKRVALISGANRGIGFAIVKKLYEKNYHLSLGTRRPEELQKKLAGWDAGRFLICDYDALSLPSAADWVEASHARFGQIDALINNAGVLRQSSLFDEDEAVLDELWAINVKAPIRLTRLCYPHLQKSKRARVINLVSLSGKRVKGKSFGYAMSKHAMMAFSHALRHIGWDDRIRVTAICPGWVNTDMVDGLCPLPKDSMTQPEDVAHLVDSVLELPIQVSIAEIPVNCVLEDLV